MLVRFWGTRGSIASPGPSTIRFGGNTSCIEVVTKGGARFILDCGTGARPLGADLMARAPKPINATILLSHTHWDHIQGFPFFAPAFVPGNSIRICGPEAASQSLPKVLAGQMEFTYFPVELNQLGARIEYEALSRGEYEIAGTRVRTEFLNHPAATLGYRIEADGVSVVYLCDHEPYWEGLWRTDLPPGKIDSILHAGDRRHAEFIENADVVIHDAQYTPEEYPAKRNWGHSTYAYATQLAALMGVKRLFLTHHDPTHNDDFLARIEERARELAASIGSKLKVSCASEGCEEEYANVGAAEPDHAAKHAGLSRSASLTVLVVDDDEDIRFLARRSLTRGEYHVLEAGGGSEALASIEKQKPDLVVLDLLMPPPDGFEVLRALRSKEETRTLPVLVLTAEGDEENVQTCFRLGATDFLSKPFTPPQLEARVRACFVRAASM